MKSNNLQYKYGLDGSQLSSTVPLISAIVLSLDSAPLFWMERLAMRIAIINMTELTTKIHATGAPKAHIKPLSTASQQLEKKRSEINIDAIVKVCFSQQGPKIKGVLPF